MMVEEESSLLQSDDNSYCGKYLRGKRLFYLIAGLFFVITIIVLGVFLAQGDKSANPQNETLPPTVLIISLDGFRWDYLDTYKDNCSNILKFASQGVRAKSMKPVFPSKTFPNHYSIVTGLYPESHGIVSNTFYDPVFNATFSIDDPISLQSRWWYGEPIWVTAQLQNQKAAPFFWPGSGAEIDGLRPTYWEPYNRDFPYSERVAKIISYFDLPRDQRPTFVSLYLEGVDSAGHDAGPNSPLVAAAIAKVDLALASLFQELTNRDLFDKINVIITADHGMASLSRSRVILVPFSFYDIDLLKLDDYINLADVFFMDLGTNLYVLPVAGKENYVYSSLLNAHPNMTIYHKEQIPDYWDYNDSRRITPIFGALTEGWTVTTKAYFNANPDAFIGGNHGYDNRLADMQAIFMARGPQFKDGGAVVEPFENIHLYSLMCHMLGLEPAPNNGSYLEVQYLLK